MQPLHWNEGLRLPSTQRRMYPRSLQGTWTEISNCGKIALEEVTPNLHYALLTNPPRFVSATVDSWAMHVQSVRLIMKANNLPMKQGSLFCFVVMRSTVLGCFRSCSWCLWKALNKEGCMGVVPWCLDLQCKSSWILNDFFTKKKIKS